MNNAKKPNAKKAVMEFIPKFWDAWEDKDSFKEEIKSLLKSIKMKVQEKTLQLLLELIKAGKIEELEYLNSFFPLLEKLLSSRTMAVKKTTLNIYKETYLWMGDGIRAFTVNLKKGQKTDLEKYFKTVDKK